MQLSASNSSEGKVLLIYSTWMSLPISARVLGAVCLLLIVFTLNLSPSTFYSATFIEKTYFEPELMPNILDGCHHVYLDMGTNM